MSFTIRDPRSWFRGGERSMFDPTITLDDWAAFFEFGGLSYPLMGLQQTLPGQEVEKIDQAFPGLVWGAFKHSSIVFSCEMVRVQHFAEARFQFRRMGGGRPGALFGTADLAMLERPWPGGTTGDLLAKMLVHADFGGNAFIARRPGHLTLLRPDWVTIVAGSPRELGVWDPDAQVVGYIYIPGGPGSGNEPMHFDVSEVAHFAPIPDPTAAWRGMSWLTPVIEDIVGDRAAIRHKTRFYENGATPNLIVGLDISDAEAFKAWVEAFRGKYEGADNAYKTMFLGAGAEAKVVGANFQQLDFKATTSVSETRIAAAAGTPATMVGILEGLSGSSLNAGNYAASRRRFADGTMRPLWRNAAGSLAQIITVPAGAELWYDDRDIPFLKDDVADAAVNLQAQANAIRLLVDGGFEPASVVTAIEAGDLSQLSHTGLIPVQVQPGPSPGSGNGTAPAAADAPAAA